MYKRFSGEYADKKFWSELKLYLSYAIYTTKFPFFQRWNAFWIYNITDSNDLFIFI